MFDSPAADPALPNRFAPVRAAAPLVRFFARRIGLSVLTLLGLVTLAFAMTKFIPGDEAQVAAGPDAGPDQVEAMRARLGLDAPAIVQYLRFIWRLLHGDLGTSIVTYQPVLRDLERVLPSTLELVAITMVLNLVIAIPVATIAAAQGGRGLDALTRIAAAIAAGLPVFWVALMLQFLLGTLARVLPISGQRGFGVTVPNWTGMRTLDALLSGNPSAFLDASLYLVLPAATLALHFSSQLFRALRASLELAAASDFIAPVKAKGASTARILWRHALPNALPPVITLAGTQIADMLGAAVLVEAVFARQGVGAYLANAVAQKDTFAVIGTVLFVGAMVCVVNLLVDAILLATDPRLRAAELARGGRQ
ncbi:ABC transporter permease [Mesorhizobium sp. BR1-1-16]|uniref:ABC transporter permease n=1 Tax=Mesorhizobium sp. BR1-1-16 TaxID=2876653 RepID=UPI001CCDE347|nr:ABC transporter permease [Mesorhizobium sp. BR1-1-16]MBZ9939410.1 ABC transporter permease [Mesorhizobium sp. BR1-1-16]